MCFEAALMLLTPSLLAFRARGVPAVSRLEQPDNLLTNPSLGFGVSELTSALRQQQPRRDIATLCVVNSMASMQEAASNAGSSPGMTSPFAALAHSPHDDADGSLAAETAFETQQRHQEASHQHSSCQEADRQQGAQQPAVDAHASDLQSASFGSDQYADASQQQASEPSSIDGGSGSMSGSIAGSESQNGADTSSDRQNYRRKGRPKCVLM